MNFFFTYFKHILSKPKIPYKEPSDVFEPRTSTGRCIFHSLGRFDAIAFVTSNRRHKNKSFPVHGKEQNHAKKENIRLPVAVRGSKTSVLKFPIKSARKDQLAFSESQEQLIERFSVECRK